jgi:hypothetical protein
MATDLHVVFRIIDAELFRSFDKLGKMDPFCKLSWQTGDGKLWEMSRTGTDWKSDRYPRWNHTSGREHYGSRSQDKVVFEVLEENFGGHGKPTFCGCASILVSDLVCGVDAFDQTRHLFKTPVMDLMLQKRGEQTGKIRVQAVFFHDLPSCHQAPVQVDSNMFIAPVSRVQVAGGTAPFFNLKLKESEAQGGRSSSFYIGKDLSHATDEVHFYQDVLTLRRTPCQGGLGPLLDFMFEYAGILQTTDATSGATKDLLVMRNMFDRAEDLRLLDIKIGQKTAAAGWQGKSVMGAFRNGIVDGFTNSSAEGFRLEGFSGAPMALKSMDPLLDIKDWSKRGIGLSNSQKKAHRLMLQRMQASQVLMHFMDVHQAQRHLDDIDLNYYRSPYEVVEIVNHEIVVQLVQLALACRASPLPQKWIGSSVAIGYDFGALRARTGTESQVRNDVKVHIFDWGRSELNTLERHTELSEEERQDRSKYWKSYTDGIDRLAWESARAYCHRFNHRCTWSNLEIDVYDFDSMSSNDFIGRANVPLTETPMTTVKLLDARGRKLRSGSLTYSITHRAYTCFQGSRLAEAWRVHIHSAEVNVEIRKTNSTLPFGAMPKI